MAVELDVKSFSQRKVPLAYPNIELGEIDVTSAIVIELLEQGEIPIIGEYSGDKRILKRISASAYNIEKLLRVHPLIRYRQSSERTLEVRSVLDYLEVIEWTY